jgi:hypothetical protein
VSAAGNFAWVAFNANDDFSGYDHDCLSSALYVYDHWRGADDPASMRGHGDPTTWLYLLSAASARLFGLHDFALALAPLLGWALALAFGFLLACDLAGGNSSAGWLAASFLAWSPFLFGPTRRFCPWSLVVGLYLAFLWGARRFQKRPTWANAALVGALAAIGGRAPHDPTTQAMFLFSAAVPLALILVDLLARKAISLGVAAADAAIMAVIAGASLAIGAESPGAWLMNYVGAETGRFSQTRGFLATLPGYLADAWLNTLQPAALWLFAGFLGVFWQRSREWRSRLWAAAPLALLLLFTLIPKKNSWYAIEALAFLPVLAGAAFALVLKTASRRMAVASVLIAQAALGGEYYFATFVASVDTPPRLARLIQGGYPIAPRLTPFAPDSYRAAARRFLDFDARRPPAERIKRLGLATDGGKGVNLMPYYLRSGDPSLRIHLALAPAAPELGQGLDAVLFVPSRMSPVHTRGVLELKTAFFYAYAAQLAAKLPGRPPDETAWRETVDRRLAAWRAGRMEDLGGEALVFLPGAAP